MAESTLSTTYTELQQEIAAYLALGRDSSGWSATEAASIAVVLKRALRQFYFPPPVGNERPHEWSFLKPVTTLDTIAPYSTGTIAVVITGTTVTLTTGVWPSWTATHGSLVVAGFGITSRFEMLLIMILMSLSSSIGPFVGQNWGAGLYRRVTLGIKYGQRFALGWGALMCLLLVPLAGPISSLFSKDPSITSIIAAYLRILPFGYGLKGLYILSNATLNVLHKPFHAAAITLTYLFVLYIPLAAIGSAVIGVKGIFGSAVIANVIIGIVAWLWLKKVSAAICLEKAPL